MSIFLMLIVTVVAIAVIVLGFWWCVVHFAKPLPYRDPEAAEWRRMMVNFITPRR